MWSEKEDTALFYWLGNLKSEEVKEILNELQLKQDGQHRRFRELDRIHRWLGGQYSAADFQESLQATAAEARAERVNRRASYIARVQEKYSGSTAIYDRKTGQTGPHPATLLPEVEPVHIREVDEATARIPSPSGSEVLVQAGSKIIPQSAQAAQPIPVPSVQQINALNAQGVQQVQRKGGYLHPVVQHTLHAQNVERTHSARYEHAHNLRNVLLAIAPQKVLCTQNAQHGQNAQVAQCAQNVRLVPNAHKPHSQQQPLPPPGSVWRGQEAPSVLRSQHQAGSEGNTARTPSGMYDVGNIERQERVRNGGNREQRSGGIPRKAKLGELCVANGDGCDEQPLAKQETCHSTVTCVYGQLPAASCDEAVQVRRTVPTLPAPQAGSTESKPAPRSTTADESTKLEGWSIEKLLSAPSELQSGIAAGCNGDQALHCEEAQDGVGRGRKHENEALVKADSHSQGEHEFTRDLVNDCRQPSQESGSNLSLNSLQQGMLSEGANQRTRDTSTGLQASRSNEGRGSHRTVYCRVRAEARQGDATRVAKESLQVHPLQIGRLDVGGVVNRPRTAERVGRGSTRQSREESRRAIRTLASPHCSRKEQVRARDCRGRQSNGVLCQGGTSARSKGNSLTRQRCRRQRRDGTQHRDDMDVGDVVDRARPRPKPPPVPREYRRRSAKVRARS